MSTAKVQKTRRTHTKSRSGCLECKRRKLKCGEEKPVCAGCIKRGIQCEYLNIGSSHSSVNADTSDTSFSTNHDPSILVVNAGPLAIPLRGPATVLDPRLTPAIPADSQKRIMNFDMEDMALWHQFIKSTAATMSDPWKDELPKLALSCDYLMHGILATGALHLGYLSSDPKEKERYTYLASQHQDLALGPFQQAMSTIKPQNASHLFAFSILLTAFNFASYRSPENLFPFSDSTSYQGLSNWMVCLRGCSSIVYAAIPHVEAGPLGFLVTRGRQIERALSSGALPDPEVDKSLSLLAERALKLPVIESTTTIEEMEAYADAIKRLRAMLAAGSQGLELSLRKAATSIWAGGVSETFIRLLSEKRPPTLIIMAHYCLLLKSCEECWYMERRSYHLFESIQQDLSEEWAIYVEYPRRMLYGKS